MKEYTIFDNFYLKNLFPKKGVASNIMNANME